MESIAGSDEAAWCVRCTDRFSSGNRNTSVHIYNQEEIDEMLLLIRNSFIPAFLELERTLKKKLQEAEEEWE